MIKKIVPRELPAEVENDIKSIPEEIANMLSHASGFLFFLISSPFLIYLAHKTGNYYYFVGTILFSITLLMVYASSTLYHSVYQKRLRHRFRVFDHISIYFLIAGSYTPFLLTHFQDTRGWTILIVQWSMVFIGSIFKIFFTHRFKIVSTLVYLIMGWLALFIIKPMIETLPMTSVIWIAMGGFFYTVGVVFYLWEKLRHNHLIWHLFVLAGSVSHFLAVGYCI